MGHRCAIGHQLYCLLHPSRSFQGIRKVQTQHPMTNTRRVNRALTVISSTKAEFAVLFVEESRETDIQLDVVIDL